MPWIDVAKGYRNVFDDMTAVLPAQYSCVQSYELGESERGILQYTTGLVTVRLESAPNANCPFLIRQRRKASVHPSDPQEWTRLWTGGRPNCGYERFELYASNKLDEGRKHIAALRNQMMAIVDEPEFLARQDGGNVNRLGSY